MVEVLQRVQNRGCHQVSSFSPLHHSTTPPFNKFYYTITTSENIWYSDCDYFVEKLIVNKAH